MTFGSFILGSFLFALGFVSVWKTTWLLNTFGDIGTMLGVYDKPWLSWKTFGLLFMLVGFLIAFGLFQLFFQLTIGRLFFFGGGL